MKKGLLILVLSLLVVLVGCGPKNTIEDTNIIVAASSTPHALILEQTREYIESKGYTLEIRTFNDYVIPNTITQDGEVDANFFQHLPYLLDFNVKNNTQLASVLAVHFEPLGIYAGKKNALDDINNAKIGIANDASNGARGLLLLAANNIITVDKSKGLNVTVSDIIDNPYNIEIVELEAAAIPAALADLDFGIINGNYALSSNIDSTRLLASEDANSLAATTFANIIVVKEGNENAEAIQVLLLALLQENIQTYIIETFGHLVVPVV